MEPVKTTLAGILLLNSARQKPTVCDDALSKKTAEQDDVDAMEVIPVATILRCDAKNLASKIPFSHDRKQKGENELVYRTGSNPQPGRVMFAEIESPQGFVGEIYRQDGVMVFDPGYFPEGQKFLFSRESFNEILKFAVDNLKNYPDILDEE